MKALFIFTATHAGILFEFAVLTIALFFYSHRTQRALNRKQVRKIGITVFAVLILRTIGELIKIGVAAPRPCWDPNAFVLIECPRSFSFPSGHALGSMMVTVLLGLITKKKVVWVVGIVLALFIAWSRVAVGVHTITDVSAAAALGTIFGWVTWRVYWHGR